MPYDAQNLEDQMAGKGCLTQAAAARTLGLSPSTIHRWMSDGSVNAIDAGETKRFVEVRSLIEHFGLPAANMLGVGSKLRELGVPAEFLVGLTDEDGNPID
jgi:hypothetical protein